MTPAPGIALGVHSRSGGGAARCAGSVSGSVVSQTVPLNPLNLLEQQLVLVGRRPSIAWRIFQEEVEDALHPSA